MTFINNQKQQNAEIWKTNLTKKYSQEIKQLDYTNYHTYKKLISLH